MRVSLEWLSQYVNIQGLAPEQIAEALTNSGLEVEGVERIGPAFTSVVVGKVLAVDKHPQADRLRLVTVALSPDLERQTRVVCGAPNVREGLLIAFAQEGAQVLNRKDGSLFRLEKAVIRGVESAGMICSLDELGLEEQYAREEDGIWPLSAVATEEQLGEDLKNVLGLDGDTVLEIAPTANRGDLMSLIGVAREVAALFDRELHLPEAMRYHTTSEKSDLLVSLPSTEVCKYYGGLVMRNLKIGPSPDWLARRLQAAGVRPISNVVDVTNYVMLEFCQPLHAFDLDKLGYRGEVSVRRANDGEKFKTLDDVERVLTTDSVVVTMNGRPVALGGVMGGLETEIDDQSKHLFLESAYFIPASNRKNAKSVGLRTEASARFERGVDIEACRTALFRAADLLKQVAGAEFQRLLETQPPEHKEILIPLHLARIERILGIRIDSETAVKILKKLGFLFKPTKEQDVLVVSVPSHRQTDVYREIDLIEEVVRIYGYDKIPYTLPQKTASVTVTLRSRTLRQIRRAMSAAGLQEVVTTSLIGHSLLEKTGFALDPAQTVAINNSHSAEHTLMRQSLLPNLLEVAKYNQAQDIENVWIYEAGRTYFKVGKPGEKTSGVVERLNLAGLITGSVLQGEWHQKESPDFYTLKGLLENLLGGLALETGLVFEPETKLPYLHPGRAAKVRLEAGNREIGVLGELHPQVRESLKFRQPVYLFELNLENLFKHLKQVSVKPEVIRISPYPAIKRDLAFSAPEAVSHQDILKTLRRLNEPLLRDIQLFDEYRGKQLEKGQRSLAYRMVFQSDAETLTDTVVDAALDKLKKTLTESLSVQFRQ